MSAHPLDPLSAEEFRAITALLRKDGRIDARWRIAAMELCEPGKDVVRAFAPGDTIAREASVLAWSRDDGLLYKGIVSIADDVVLSWTPQPGQQANATVDEFHDAGHAMLAHPDVIATLAGRGITDLELVLVDTWTFGGHLIPPKYAGRRLGWCDIWVRERPDSNPYAHLVSGLKLIVDLNSLELLEIEESDPIAPAPVSGEYVGVVQRTDLKPLEITQPEGVSFTLDGYRLQWQDWTLRVGFNHREGLVLHRLAYAGRPVANRLSLAEMVVPYRDPTVDHFRRTAYDIGEWGLGFMTTSLELGCDCLGEIRYLDAVLHDTAGEPYEIRNAVCLHEEDDAVLWKHVDERTGAEVRRRRRMVISSHMTVANYEYLVYWRLYQDGAIECEIRATGIMVTTPFEGDPPPYGTVIDTRTYAPIHQHFIVARLDMEVDGEQNTVIQSETVAPLISADNPHGLALTQRSVPLTTEGGFDYDWATQRTWKVSNPNKLNHVGTPVSYKLVPSASIPPLIDESSPVFQRAQVIGRTLWVTPYSAEERWPCGEFVNQSSEDTGLPAWTRAGRSIENTDVVLWYVAGIHHVPRIEDWPIMPVDAVSFRLVPWGFFDRNPTLDVAPSHHC